MKKHITFLILLLGFLSHGQDKPIVIYQEAPDRQKITEFEKRNDSLVISLENSGTNKVYIGDIAGVALGETSITAYRGDRGKTAYDHTSLSNNPHSVTKSQVGLGNVDNTSDANKPISTLTQTALNAKANINSPTFTGNVIVPTATISDAAVNLGQMMDSLATIEVSASGIVSQYMDSDKTLEQSDFGKYIYTDESIKLTIDNTPVVNSKLGLKPIDISKTITVETNGVTFQGDGRDISAGFVVDSLNLATVFKLANNLYSVDGVYKPYVPPVNLYGTANAASPINEANSTTGITAQDGTVTLSSVGSPVTNGSYAIKGATNASEKFIYINRPSGVESGKTYKISMDISHNAPGSGYSLGTTTANQWSIEESTPVPMASGYNRIEITRTLSSITNADSGRIRFYISNAQNIDYEVFFDNIIWEEAE